MKLIENLMEEHRLIERMVTILEYELENIEKFDRLNPILIENAVDFIRSYADRTHHGKEEEILFQELKKRKLSPQHEEILNELIEDHKIGRNATDDLVKANVKFINGDRNSLDTIIKKIRFLANFYPKHIEKEDKGFYYPIMEYFSKDEQEELLKKLHKYDQDMIHKKYRNLILTLEKERNMLSENQ